ncbi:MAG: L,D-transpeptidase family protein, partial [Devosia sp.]|nr:L,D-transpeptidase family protein [Devosia sp.]
MRRPCPDLIRSLFVALLALFLVAPAVVVPALAQDRVDLSPRDLAVVRINIIDLLANEPRLPLPIKQRRDVLRTYYEEQSGDLLWLNSARAAVMVSRLTNATDDGLNPDDYPGQQLAGLMAAAGETDKRSLAIIELYFSAAFLEYASDLKVGRFLPNKIDPNFFLTPRTIDEAAALAGVAKVADVETVLHAWEPQNAEYQALRKALDDYHALAVLGGWGTVPLGDTLKPGMTDPRIPALRARLAVTDGAAATAPGEPELYDEALVEAVKHFQARHGLDVDGVVGPASLVAMNVPIEDRIESIDFAMERWRWMPDDLGRQYIIVNI